MNKQEHTFVYRNILSLTSKQNMAIEVSRVSSFLFHDDDQQTDQDVEAEAMLL
jgi:hypothetical protein